MQVVAFLRQPNILDILRERHAVVAGSAVLRDKIAAVRTEGSPALERFQYDVQLTVLLRWVYIAYANFTRDLFFHREYTLFVHAHLILMQIFSQPWLII